MNSDPLWNKHPLAIRWFHWINFPILALMIWSGLYIYWANDVYFPFFPKWFYAAFKLDHRLAQGMGWHFMLMWIFAANGAIYVTYLLASGEWRELFPKRQSWREALEVALHDLGIRKEAPAHGKFNAAQRIAYTSVVAMGVGSLLTGLAIYKPVQVSWLTSLLGGYRAARLEHFALTLGYVGFFVVHLGQVVRAGWRNFQAMVSGVELLDPSNLAAASTARRLARRGFISLGVGAVSGALGWAFLLFRPDEDGIPAPFRRGYRLNELLWRRLVSAGRAGPDVDQPAPGIAPRVNGDIGLDDEDEIAGWTLHVTPHEIKLAELTLLPRTETLIEFKCVEGWSESQRHAGVRFSDFLERYRLGRRADGSFYPYVALETPDAEYYVSIDMESMLHPQTLLSYEMNGARLQAGNGAPLRLSIPTKYGIKSLKRVGRIYFAEERPRDYWAERGYDWYSQL